MDVSLLKLIKHRLIKLGKEDNKWELHICVIILLIAWHDIDNVTFVLFTDACTPSELPSDVPDGKSDSKLLLHYIIYVIMIVNTC